MVMETLTQLAVATLVQVPDQVREGEREGVGGGGGMGGMKGERERGIRERERGGSSCCSAGVATVILF